MANASQMEEVTHYRLGAAHVCFDPCLSVDDDPLAWFDPQNPNLLSQPVVTGGRQAAWFVSIQGKQAVLRHYRRGGLVASLSRDRYVWTGLSATRSFAEFSLMRELCGLGLQVPAPLAAAVWRDGFTYRAAILVSRVPGARTIAECDDVQAWENAGVAVARMHASGVWHADLNVHNILIDNLVKAWLIDFDRGRRFESLSDRQKQDNLDRLHRSIRKVLPDKVSVVWPIFTKAYQQTLD